MRPVHFAIDAIALPFGGELGEALIANGEVLRAVIEGDLAGQARAAARWR